jgi:hypothetical protein
LITSSVLNITFLSAAQLCPYSLLDDATADTRLNDHVLLESYLSQRCDIRACGLFY